MKKQPNKPVLIRVGSANRTCIPVATFGGFSAIDRHEIESFRSVQSLLRRYVQRAEQFKNDDARKPISIAVFGPPGSGKSFGVKSIAEAITRDGRDGIDWNEFNLAQFSSPNDLVLPLLKARDAPAGKMPVIFFDEFDSSLAGVPLGWLRYFLQPMQDGQFKHNEEVRKLGPAIFVFAGGTSASYAEFTREGRSESAQEEFRLAKGPDFVSRLSGHIDTLGINKRNANDRGYVLRRAILLRSQLEKRKLIDANDAALVDRGFLEAVLKVSHYKHGARFLEKLLQMCVTDQGEVRLPGVSQLQMHIETADAESLWG